MTPRTLAGHPPTRPDTARLALHPDRPTGRDRPPAAVR
jgi:hypothetical protein